MPHTDIHASDLPAAYDELEGRYNELTQRIAEIDEAMDDEQNDSEPISPPNEDGSFSVQQIPLVCAIINHLTKQHGEIMMEPRRDNAVIEAANLIVEAYGKPIIKAAPGMGIEAWLASNDTGLSSLAMVRHLRANDFWRGAHLPYAIRLAQHDWQSHPHDPSDFGRCVRLLEAVPEIRGSLHIMSSLSPVWAAYVARWDEMETLYREELPTGSAPKLYALMQAIQDQTRKEPPCEPKPSGT